MSTHDARRTTHDNHARNRICTRTHTTHTTHTHTHTHTHTRTRYLYPLHATHALTLVLALVLALITLSTPHAALAQVCTQTATLRTATCPLGGTGVTCNSKGTQLAISDGDNNVINTINLCNKIVADESVFATVFNVKSYGAVCDGTTDDTAAFTSALTAMPSVGGILYIPSGTCVISSIAITTPMTITGDGFQASTLKTNSATANVIAISSSLTPPITSQNGVIITNLRFASAVTRTAGAYIVAGADRTVIDNVYMAGQFIGIDVGHGDQSRFTRTEMRNGATGAGSAGIIFETTMTGGSALIDGVTIQAASGAQQSAGIWVKSCGSLTIDNSQVVLEGDDLKIDGAAFSIYAHNTFFDTATNGIHFTSGAVAARSSFVGCWTSSHTGSGVLIDSTNYGNINFVGHTAYLNGVNGFTLNGGAGVNITGGQIAGNTSAGISVAANVSDLSIVGNNIGSSASESAGTAGNGTYGIVLAAGTSNNVLIAINKLIGNTSGAVSGTLTGANDIITGNLPASVNTSGVVIAGDLGGTIAAPLVINAHYAYISKSIDYTALAADLWIDCDATSGTRTITLPSAVTVGAGKPYIVKKLDTTGNACNLATTSSQTIDGASTASAGANQYGVIVVISDGANWKIQYRPNLTGNANLTSVGIIRWNADAADIAGSYDVGISRAGASNAIVNNGGTSGIGTLGYAQLQVAKTTAYSVLALDSGTLFNNTGSSAQVIFTMPACATVGLKYTFEVTVAQNIRVLAVGSDKIYDGTNISATAGHIDSATIGTSIELKCATTNQWHAIVNGTRTVT